MHEVLLVMVLQFSICKVRITIQLHMYISMKLSLLYQLLVMCLCLLLFVGTKPFCLSEEQQMIDEDIDSSGYDPSSEEEMQDDSRGQGNYNAEEQESTAENKPKLEVRRQRRNEGNLRLMISHFCLVVVIILECACKFEVQDDSVMAFHIFSTKMLMNLITGKQLIRRTLMGLTKIVKPATMMKILS